MINLGSHMVHANAMLKGECKGSTAEHMPVFRKKARKHESGDTYWIAGPRGGHLRVYPRENGGYFYETVARGEVRGHVNVAGLSKSMGPAMAAAALLVASR